MAIVVLGFISILLATFVVVIAMTRQSPNEQTIAQRMALIRITAKKEDGATPETTQLFKTTRKGRFEWLDEILQRYQFAQRLQLRILQGNSSTTVATLLLTSLGLFVAGYCIVWLFVSMVLVDAAGGLALGLLPYGVLSFKRSRRIKAFNAVLAESIDMLARALRAGHSVASAIEMLSENAQEPAASEFGEIFKQMNLGLPMRDALLQLLERVPSADLRVLVTAILVQKDTGGNLAEILDRTVFVIRERLRIQGEIQVQTAQGRITGWILSALPIVMMVVLNLVNPGYSTILFQDPFGRKLMYFSMGMLALGAFIIRRIVNGIEV
jgi:tight adherence protein B